MISVEMVCECKLVRDLWLLRLTLCGESLSILMTML